MDTEPVFPGMDAFISSGNPRLDAQLKFTAVIDRMTSILRRTQLLDLSRSENDAEHSWHIAVMALLFQEYAVEKPNVSHAIEMMLVHDLVEIYAGDTFAYDVKGYEDKAAKEQAAADKLFAVLPPDQRDFIRGLWEEFDASQTVDALYANCLDRIQPFFHNTLTGGYTWLHGGMDKVTRQQVCKRMDVVRQFMPAVYEWALKCIDNAIANGWLKNEVIPK